MKSRQRRSPAHYIIQVVLEAAVSINSSGAAAAPARTEYWFTVLAKVPRPGGSGEPQGADCEAKVTECIQQEEEKSPKTRKHKSGNKQP